LLQEISEPEQKHRINFSFSKENATKDIGTIMQNQLSVFQKFSKVFTFEMKIAGKRPWKEQFI
jgi:hypothetical protein